MSWLDDVKSSTALDGRWLEVQQALRMRAGDLSRAVARFEELVWVQLDGIDTLSDMRQQYRNLTLHAKRLGMLSASIRSAYQTAGTLRTYGSVRSDPLPPPPELPLEIPLVSPKWLAESPRAN